MLDRLLARKRHADPIPSCWQVRPTLADKYWLATTKWSPQPALLGHRLRGDNFRSIGKLIVVVLTTMLVHTCSVLAVRCHAEPQVQFNRDVRPLLSEYCFHCHGPDAASRQAGLRLDTPEGAASVLASQDGELPELVWRLTTDDADMLMPPADSHKEMPQSARKTLLTWIAQGAEYQEHWAWIAPRRPPLPAHATDPWCRNPIDAFTLNQMAQQGLRPSPPVGVRRLIRRVTLDLTGLPPTSEDVQRFLAEYQSAGSLNVAYERLVDRLLSSSAHAEHMTLSWLEAARYADTDGYQNDRYRYQHVWRDWVIQAFCQNKPYDQFIIEQLAGDLLPHAGFREQVATGFGRNHRINSEDGSIPEEWRVENVVDRVDTLGTVVLGLTVGCARCHDHKYDPISQREYYRLFAYFNNIAETGIGPNNGNSPPFIEVPENWPLLSEQEEAFVKPEPVKLRRARKTAGNGLRRPQAGPPSTVMVMHELERPRDTFLLVRGEYDQPDRSQKLAPGVPAVLCSEDELESAPKDRLELARWLVRDDHPLTARVRVNRLWQLIFGRGLVETSENLGVQGSSPTHPRLLDWLAREFVESGWDQRHVLRTIVMSATYRQSSAADASLLARDPGNVWLARAPRRRLSAFQLRDQALAASGLLVRKIGGPSVKPYMPPKIWSSISNNRYEQDSGESLFRRSLYTYWRRTIPPPTMMAFNAAGREVCAVRNELTNTPLQALTLLNNKTFVEAARVLAQRMLTTGQQPECGQPECRQSAGSLPEERISEERISGERGGAKAETLWCITQGFEFVLGREPRESELQVMWRAFEQFETEFRNAPASAKELLQVGEAKKFLSSATDGLPKQASDKAACREAAKPASEADAEQIKLASMTMVASLILNLDEAVTRE